MSALKRFVLYNVYATILQLVVDVENSFISTANEH